LNRAISFLLLLCGASISFSQSVRWPATVTDATIRDCDDGAIDLHPPGPGVDYYYTWYNRASSLPIAHTEDIGGLAPGTYRVVVQGPLCYNFECTYFVWLKDYNFGITKKNPANCDESKITIENGSVLIKWDENIQPQPTITWMSDPHTGTPVSNDTWVGPMNPGQHEFRSVVGDCEWSFFVELCCCSVEDDYNISVDNPELCQGLADGIPLWVELIGIIGATDSNTPDGELQVRIHSPGPNPVIRWRGPRRNGTTYMRSGLYHTNLYSGEYCYTYTDDCLIAPKTGCFEVDDCDVGGNVKATYDVISICQDENDGSMGTYVSVRGARSYEVFTIDPNGETGSEASNVTIDLDRDQRWNFHFDNLTPGDHIYRIISEQKCEYDINFELPQRIDSYEVDPKSCTRLVYCDGRVMERSVPQWQLIDSEVCYIDRFMCTLTGDIRGVNNFDASLVSSLEFDLEEGSCRFLYSCTDDSPAQFEGSLFWQLLSTDCRIENAELGPQATFGLVCRTPDRDGVSNEIDISQFETISAIRGGYLGCTCNPPGRPKRAEYSFVATSPDGLQVPFDCCTSESCPTFALTDSSQLDTPINLQSTIDVVNCINQQGAEKALKLIEVATGRVMKLSAEQRDDLLNLITRQGSILQTSAELSLLPGVYILESPRCGSVKFVQSR